MEETDPELEALRIKKAENILKTTQLQEQVVKIHSHEDYTNLLRNFPDKVLVLDFTAVWCGPCKFFGPIFEKVASEYSGEFIFGKVDVDENPVLARQYQITGVPTTLFVRNGTVITKAVGALNESMLKQKLDVLKSNQ